MVPEVNEISSSGSVAGKEIEKSGEEDDDGSKRSGGNEVPETKWSDVSPAKQARTIQKTNDASQIISSASRFAILGEEHDANGDSSKEEDGESEMPLEGEEEGEIVEKKALVDSEEEEDLEKCREQQKPDAVDGVNTRRTSTRQTKGQTKSGVETKSQNTSNLASTMGKNAPLKNINYVGVLLEYPRF